MDFRDSCFSASSLGSQPGSYSKICVQSSMSVFLPKIGKYVWFLCSKCKVAIVMLFSFPSGSFNRSFAQEYTASLDDSSTQNWQICLFSLLNFTQNPGVESTFFSTFPLWLSRLLICALLKKLKTHFRWLSLCSNLVNVYISSAQSPL